MVLYHCSAHGVQPSGRPWSFRIGVVSASNASTVEAAWAAAVTSAWTDGTHGIQTLFPTATTLTLTKTEQLAVVTVGTTPPVQKLRVTAIAQDTLALAGTSANPSLPEQNAILVSLRTAKPGREGRGRIHLPAPDETLVTAGEMGATPTTRVSTSIEALRAAMAGAGHVPSLIVAVQTKIGTIVGTTTAINLVETDRIVRTMRTRNKSRKAVYA